MPQILVTAVWDWGRRMAAASLSIGLVTASCASALSAGIETRDQLQQAQLRFEPEHAGKPVTGIGSPRVLASPGREAERPAASAFAQLKTQIDWTSLSTSWPIEAARIIPLPESWFVQENFDQLVTVNVDGTKLRLPRGWINGSSSPDQVENDILLYARWPDMVGFGAHVHDKPRDPET